MNKRMNRKARQFCKHLSNVHFFFFEEFFESFRSSFEYYDIFGVVDRFGVVEPREENRSPMTDSHEHLDD